MTALKNELNARFEACKLTLHPTKTQIIYCKDEDRKGCYIKTSFDFLGYTFRPRMSKNRHGKYFVNFSPAMSDKAAKLIRSKVKQWKWNLRPGDSLEDLARECNSKIRGWIAYYGRYYYSALFKILVYIDYRLMLWATHKFKRLKGRQQKAKAWLKGVIKRDPNLFVHWVQMQGNG